MVWLRAYGISGRAAVYTLFERVKLFADVEGLQLAIFGSDYYVVDTFSKARVRCKVSCDPTVQASFRFKAHVDASLLLRRATTRCFCIPRRRKSMK